MERENLTRECWTRRWACRPLQPAFRAVARVVSGRDGRFWRGPSYADQGIRLAEAVNHPYGLVAAYSSAGLLHLRQGDLDTASSLLERALSLCRTAKIALMLPTVAASLGATYALAGRLTESLSLLEEAVAQATAMGIMVYQASAVAGTERGTSVVWSTLRMP